MFGPVLLEKCCTAIGVANATTCMRHDPFAVAISITTSKLIATFALYSRVNFYGSFFCGSFASATAFKTSLFASAIQRRRLGDAVGK